MNEKVSAKLNYSNQNIIMAMCPIYICFVSIYDRFPRQSFECYMGVSRLQD